MQTRQTYAVTMATAALISSSIGISVSEFSETWMIFVFPFLALASGAITGWYIPAWLIGKTANTRTWAALSGMACACISMVLCATGFSVFLIFTGAAHIAADILMILLFCNFVTQIACGLFAYPLGALAGLTAHQLDQSKKAAADTITAFE